jgi:subtilisin family serine protease
MKAGQSLPQFGPEDPRTPEQRLEDLRRISGQVTKLSTRLTDTGFGVHAVDVVKSRRGQRTDVVQFDTIPDSHNESTLAVVGELLIREEAVADAQDIITAENLIPGPVAELDGRVVRLSNGSLSAQRLAEVAHTLRGRGVPVSAHYVAPMGVVAKGLTGPEPSAGPAPRRQRAGKGEAVRVAVIDTGIPKAKRKDGWLSGLAKRDNIDPLDDFPPNGTLDIGAAHGNFTTAIVEQVAPGANIAVYKALDSDGVGDEVCVAAAMVRAAREGVKKHKKVLINLSVGMETADDERPVALDVAMEMLAELEEATGREIKVVAAAGNFGHDRPCWPAAFPGVIAVGALTQALQPTTWSTRGFWVDCSTMGEGVRSAFVQGKESPMADPHPDTFERDAWALWSGTSFTAPQVVGAIALLAQQEKLSLRSAFARLIADQPHIPGFGPAVRILPPTWRAPAGP